MNINDYDWNLWLPPAELPHTGAKKFAVGQIWAGCYSKNKEVYLIVAANEFNVVKTKALAGNPYQFCPQSDSTNAHHSILVADVGCEPIDPDLLYQAFYK